MFSGTVAIERCHITQWHDGLKRYGKAGMLFKTTSVQDTTTWRTTQFTPCFPFGCWLPMDCEWVSSGSQSMSQNCAPHSARHSGLLQTCSLLYTPWNFRGAGFVGPIITKGWWWLSWTNRHCGWILGSLTQTKLELPIKWMEACRFSSSKESAPYTMCCEGDAHCGVWHWWG